MSANIINKIAGLKKSATTFRANVQEIGLLALAHAKDHGDASLLSRLFDAVGAGANRSSLKAWLFNAAPLSEKDAKGAKDAFSVNGKDKVFGLKKDRTDADWDMEYATKTMWWDAKAENLNLSPIDILKVLTKAAMAQDIAQEGQEIRNEDLIAFLMTNNKIADAVASKKAKAA
jgi:hypothetical protein